MARYKPSQEEDDLYGGGVGPPDNSDASAPDDTQPDKSGAEDDTQTTDEETAQTENTALVSNKVLVGPDGQPPKEGDQITLEVVKVYGDEAEVRATSTPKETGPEMGQSSDSEIEAMDQPEMM